MIGTLVSRIGRAFGYDAVEDKTHRRRVSTLVQSEDRELPSAKRQKLIGQTHDVRRNFEVAAWAVRRHLDFVATFNFASKTGNQDWDRECERFIKEASTPRNFDASGRHSLRKALRIGEALRVIGGDVARVGLSDGRSQLIEGDRIRRHPPERRDADKWCHGVKINDAGRAQAYAVWNRKGTGYVWGREIPASRLYLHGYFDRYDQIRGVSPLAAALNRLRDVYENIDYALAKAKVVQLFGLALYRDTPDVDDDDDEVCEGDESCPDDEYKLDPDKGPFTLNLTAKERAEILQSNHPGNEFTQFTQVCVSIALKSLDIPFCFFDEAYTNFFGIKTAQALYQMACVDKRQDNRDFLDHWTRWRLGLAVANGDLRPQDYGLSWEEVDRQWSWIALGVPWFDKSREVKGDKDAVDAGFQTRGDVIRERLGEDFYDVVDRMALENEYAKSKGVAFGAPAPAAVTPESIDEAITRSKEDDDADEN